MKIQKFSFFFQNFYFFSKTIKISWQKPRKFLILDVFSSLHYAQEFRRPKNLAKKLEKFFENFQFLFVYFCFEFSTLKCQFLICHWALLYNSLIKFFKFFKNPKRFYFLKEVNSLDFTTRFTTVENWKLFHFLAPSVHSICG